MWYDEQAKERIASLKCAHKKVIEKWLAIKEKNDLSWTLFFMALLVF